MAKILASRFREHSVLHSDAKITFYRKKDKVLIQYFSKEDGFVFCCNVKELLYPFVYKSISLMSGVCSSTAANEVLSVYSCTMATNSLMSQLATQ